MLCCALYAMLSNGIHDFILPFFLLKFGGGEYDVERFAVDDHALEFG